MWRSRIERIIKPCCFAVQYPSREPSTTFGQKNVPLTQGLGLYVTLRNSFFRHTGILPIPTSRTSYLCNACSFRILLHNYSLPYLSPSLHGVPLTYGISSYELYVFDFTTLTAKTLEHANLDAKIPIVCFMRLLFKFYPLMVAEF